MTASLERIWIHGMISMSMHDGVSTPFLEGLVAPINNNPTHPQGNKARDIITHGNQGPRKQAMDIQHILHMVGGEGETSYSLNSNLQKRAIRKAKPVVLGSIVDLYNRTLPKCLCIADLGCGPGPNTLFVITEIIQSIESVRNGMGHPPLEYHLALNDLPGNDFNTIFKSLSTFCEKLKKEKGHQLGPCFISGVPGSFHGRLFPSKSIHFFHSSYSVHWLSQVPPGIEDNKGQINLVKTSPPKVLKAYLEQFQKDFSGFLRSRYEEIVPGGHMVITILGRKSMDDFSSVFYCNCELLTKSLNDLVSEGLAEETKVDAFNLPIYAPCVEEVKTIIQTEGLFVLEKLEIFETNWDPTLENDTEEFMTDKFTSAQNIATYLRAVMEILFVQNFGDVIKNIFFQRFMENVANYLSDKTFKEQPKNVNLVISMRSRK